MEGNTRLLSIKIILELPDDQSSFRFQHGDQIENAYAFNEYLRANVEQGKTLLLTRIQILGLIRKFATTLSCGGLDSLPMVCLGADCIRYTTCPLASVGHAVPVGESCQPPGETVRTTSGVKNIEDLNPLEDRVISFDIHAGREREKTYKSKGRPFLLYSRQYSGTLYTLSAGINKYRCTHDHIAIAKWNDNSKNLFIVYLMQRGNFFRVGKTKLWIVEKSGKTHFGLAQRARTEKADRAWILGVYTTNTEALLAEERFSIMFSAPKSCFLSTIGRKDTKYDGLYKWVTQGQLDNHFLTVCRSVGHYSTCLTSLGLDIRYPIWEYDVSNRNRNPGLNNSGKIRACNIISGLMDLPVMSSSNTIEWHVAALHKEEYSGTVFSLDVDVEHTYITNNIITHNCPVEKAELANHVRRLGKDFEDLPSYADQLLVQGVAACEIIKSRVYADMSASPNAVITVGRGVDKFGNAITDRTDNPNYRIWSNIHQTEQKLLKSLHMTLDQRKKLEGANSKRDPNNLRALYRKRLQELKSRNKVALDVIDITTQSVIPSISGENNENNGGIDTGTGPSVQDASNSESGGNPVGGDAGNSGEGIKVVGTAKKLVERLNKATERARKQDTSQSDDGRRTVGAEDTKSGADDGNMEVVE